MNLCSAGKYEGQIVPPAWPDSPNSSTVQIGDFAGAIIRNGRGGSTNGVSASIGHISFGIGDWNAERVRAELMERDVAYDINGKRAPRDDMAGGLESFHVPGRNGMGFADQQPDEAVAMSVMRHVAILQIDTN